LVGAVLVGGIGRPGHELTLGEAEPFSVVAIVTANAMVAGAQAVAGVASLVTENDTVT
jgi:hypothetical protein